MKTGSRHRFWRSSLAAALLAAVGGALSPAQAEDTVKIGAPLELSGKFVAYGQQSKRGIDMAVEVFGGKIGDKKIEILYRDIQSNNQNAITAFTELTQEDKVDFIIGPTASSIVASIVPVWRETKPLWIATGSSSTQFEEAMKGEPLFFHTYPWSYNYHTGTSKVMAEAAGKGKKLAIVYEDSYGREQVPFAKQYYTEAGFDVVTTELMRSGATDLNPILQHIRLLKPDVLLGIVQTTDGVQLAKQIDIAKLNVPYLVGTAYPQLTEWVDAVGSTTADGWIGTTTYLPGVNRPGDAKLPKLFPGSLEWEKLYRARYNADPGFLDVTNYTSMMLLLVAIDKAGTMDKSKVAETMANLDIQTMLGNSKFVPTQGGVLHQAFSDMLVYQRQNGKAVIVYPPDAADGKLVPRK